MKTSRQSLLLLLLLLLLMTGTASALASEANPYQCSAENPDLVAWLQRRLQNLNKDPLLPFSTSYGDFVLELKRVLDDHILPERAVVHLFSDKSPVQPTCVGDWLEFGVFTGGTINLAAAWKWQNCGALCNHIFGFDTFTGLPEAWKRIETDGPMDSWPAGTFDLQGSMPQVLGNVYLWQGLFADTLPAYLNMSRAFGQYGPATYVHMDCDIYSGTKDVLQLLSDRLQVGTVILFDDLVNYAAYRRGELKAMWEWLQASGIKLATLGIFGPLEGTSEAMQLTVDSEHHWFHQSVAFVVAEKPQTPMKPWKDLSDAEATGRSLTGATDGHAGHLQVGKSLSSLTTTGSREAAGIGNVLSVASSGKAQPKDAIPHATTPSSQTKVVDGQHFNIPGTEHAAGSHQSTSKDAGAEPAGRSHRTTGNQRVSLRSHVGSQGSHRHKHFSR